MIKDKLTQAIAEAAQRILQKESWPDSAQTSLYVDKAGKAPITDAEAGSDHQGTDEAADKSRIIKPGAEINYKGKWCRVDSVEGDHFICSDEDGGEHEVPLSSSEYNVVRESADESPIKLKNGVELEWIKGSADSDGDVIVSNVPDDVDVSYTLDCCDDFSIESGGGRNDVSYRLNNVYDKDRLIQKLSGEIPTVQESISNKEISEALKASQPPSEWIEDFVNSKDAKFKGKSKAERINMALGAYYAAQHSKGVKEGVEEPRSAGEKAFKAAHTIVKMHDPSQDDQTGVEAMGDVKPKLPTGTTPSKAANVDGEAENEEDVKKIKASAQSAKAPAATGRPQPGTQSAEKLVDTTRGGKQSAEAPKATGGKQSGTQSAEKVKDTAPDGKLNAEEPKATGGKQKGSEPMPKGLKETALSALLGDDRIDEGLFDTVKALGKHLGRNIVNKLDDIVSGKIEVVVGAIQKAKQQGDRAEVARLQADLDQLQIMKLHSVSGKIEIVGGAIQKAKRQGDQAEVARLQAHLDQLQIMKVRAHEAVVGAIQKAKRQGDQAEVARLQAHLDQLQNMKVRLAQRPQRGVTEDVSFNEAFEILGEKLIKECMSNFDKQFADDHEKELKQLIAGQGTEGIDSRLLPELNKFITSYGDDLKKYLGLPMKHLKENEEANALVDKLNHIGEALERCNGFVPRSPSYSNVKLLTKLQEIDRDLSDVCEELEAIEDHEATAGFARQMGHK